MIYGAHVLKRELKKIQTPDEKWVTKGMAKLRQSNFK